MQPFSEHYPTKGNLYPIAPHSLHIKPDTSQAAQVCKQLIHAVYTTDGIEESGWVSNVYRVSFSAKNQPHSIDGAVHIEYAME